MKSALSTSDQQRSTIQGITFLILGLACFSFQDIIVKYLSGDYAAHQIVFFRCIAAIPILFIIAYLEGGFGRLHTKRPCWQLLRSLAGFCAYTSFYLCIASVPLGLATTLFFAAPLFVTVLAVPVLGEKVGVNRWIALSIGFIGVVVALQPGTDKVDPIAVLAIAASFFYSIQILITRHISSTETGASLAFYSMFGFLLFSCISYVILGGGLFETNNHPSIAFLVRSWAMPSLTDLALMSLCGLSASLGIYGIGQAYRLGQASVISPFEYSSLIWATLWGFLFWNEIPSFTTLCGIVLIIFSGIYLLHRETLSEHAN